ncbi:MAG: LysR family transcriptional regulator [Plectolyngbya sp. WJT66-NPBG17]|jgi:DNA-binding transcriptional LysR family regulator|nr:LysR family transcriptional regulator [Plectolyngbya sp. WJT66-NPBG17]MBW4525970.1 LysR family transcriptional regulator [Phormidium tanganyikae FI6-MK23]
MVNLEWYRSFVAVYRVGTVSGAAESLYLTQPAVSQHIAGLEATLGVTLFQRMPRRMLPTEAGKRLYTRVVNAIETLESVPTKIADTPLLIRLGTPTEFFSEMILKQFDGQVQVAVRFGLVQELIEQLLSNQIDCAIATQKIPNSAIECHPLFEESFWLVAPPAVNVEQTDLALLEQWLKQQSWIAYGEELPIIRRFWRVVFGRRLETIPQFVIPDLRMIRDAISQGLGYSVLPDYLCADWVAAGRLTLILKPEKAVTNQIWLAHRKSERRSQSVQFLLEQFQP